MGRFHVINFNTNEKYTENVIKPHVLENFKSLKTRHNLNIICKYVHYFAKKA